MKKILALILALFLMASVLPMAAMAEAPAEVSVKLRNISKSDDIIVNLKEGDVFYATSSLEKAIVKHEDAAAPADRYIKLEYVSGVVKATLKNFVIEVPTKADERHAIEFTEGDYKVEMELVGDNVINQLDSSAIFYKNSGGLTIFGDGKLSMSFGNAEASANVAGAIWGFGGDMVLKSNFDIFIDSAKNTLHHAFLLNTGNIIFDGAKVNAKMDGGQVVFLGMPNPSKAQQVRYRNDLDTDTSRTITIKNSEITSSGALSAFRSAAPAIISNSILKLSKTGTATGDTYSIFIPFPTFEGDCTVLGGLASKPENAKVLQPKKLSSYTYIEVLNYVQETEPTTVPTEPDVPDTDVPDTDVPDTDENVPGGETTPDQTIPPIVINPNGSVSIETKPVENTTPDASTPTETTPNTTEPVGTTDTDNSGKSVSPLKIILIIMLCLVVAAGVAVGVVVFQNKKKQAE